MSCVHCHIVCEGEACSAEQGVRFCVYPRVCVGVQAAVGIFSLCQAHLAGTPPLILHLFGVLPLPGSPNSWRAAFCLIRTGRRSGFHTPRRRAAFTCHGSSLGLFDGLPPLPEMGLLLILLSDSCTLQYIYTARNRHSVCSHTRL